MNKTLADYLEIWGLEGNSVIYTDGSLGFGLTCKPLDNSSWSNEQINELSLRVTSFLNSLPSGINIQFVQDITGGNLKTIEQHEAHLKENTTQVVCDLTRERAKRLKQLDADGILPRHVLRLFVRKPLSQALSDKPRWFSKPKNFEQISSERFNLELHALERIKSDLLVGLNTLGIQTEEIKSEEIIKLIYEQWNPDRSVPLNQYDPEEVRSSLVFTDVGIYQKGFTMSDIHYRVISLKLLPDQTYASMSSVLRDLPFDSRLYLTIHIPDQIKELESLKAQRRIVYSMVAGKKGVSDLESEAKYKDLESLLEDMVAQGEKVFHVGLNVVLKHKDLTVLDDYVSQTLMKFRELSGAEGLEETLASFDVFSQVSLPNAKNKERVKKLKTSNLSDLLPIFGPWQGFDDPKILLRSRMGSLVKFNPFAKELTNYNQIVSGGSGSGKSFLTNILMMHVLKEDPKVFIVDIGGSYKKLCENFDGQYIPLGADSNFSINPFDLSKDEKIPSSQKIKFILSLVEIMTKEDGDSRLGRLERAEVENAIAQVFETSESPCLSNLREILLKHTDPTIVRLGKILAPWCGNTPYGRFVDAKTTIQLEKPIVCFDLKGMETYPDLQAAVLFIITDFVWREVQSDRSRMKFLVFDECWKLLENESGATFIAEVFRTFRKYMASAIAISQNIDDFAKSKVANAILPNSSIKWILKQKGADFERLKSVLALNDNELSLISSLHQERGEYSEAFLMAEDNRCVVAIESTPLEYWLATTDPRDLAKIDEYKLSQPNLTNLEVLKNISAKYPKGIAAIQIKDLS